ncbi:MAG TPA: phosphopantetheine-binding protein [Egibacteraceae bacterium]|nr:phosphopantetheine-binding protein [Egibacteraceae bacterium]
MSDVVTREEILALLMDRLSSVLGLGDEELDEASHFDEDLHADSLDLVEVIESVERALAERGVYITMSDEELVALRTVGEAADKLAELAEGEG